MTVIVYPVDSPLEHPGTTYQMPQAPRIGEILASHGVVTDVRWMPHVAKAGAAWGPTGEWTVAVEGAPAEAPTEAPPEETP